MTNTLFIREAKMIWQDGCFMILGFLALLIGVLIRVGKFKSFYWLIPFNYYRTTLYGAIPFGISFLTAVMARPFLDTFWAIPFRIVMITCFILYLFMWLFEPRFAKPAWINQLEDNHTNILPELRREMWRMSASERKHLINNQTALEAWVAEFRYHRYS